MRFRTILTLAVCLLIMIGIIRTPCVHSVQTTTISINPKHGLPLLKESHIINITVTNVTNLSNWQLLLSFDPRIINCTRVLDPTTDLNNIFAGYSIIWPQPEIDNTKGLIRCFCAVEVPFGINGSGNLCQIEFKTMTLGVSSLNLIIGEAATYIRTPPPDNSMIPFEGFDGIVEVIVPGLLLNTFVVTQNGKTYYVTVRSNSTVTAFDFNQTSVEMRFNVAGQSGTSGYSSVSVPKKLLNGTVTILLDNTAICHRSKSFGTLPENATNCYICFTYAHSTKSVKIRATVTGDINGDRRTNIRDIAIAASAYGSYPGNPRWVQVADVNFDNKINIRDISMIASNFGSVWRIQ